LHERINFALKPVKQRIPVKPTKAAKERRLQEKKKQSIKKKLRQKPEVFEE